MQRKPFSLWFSNIDNSLPFFWCYLLRLISMLPFFFSTLQTVPFFETKLVLMSPFLISPISILSTSYLKKHFNKKRMLVKCWWNWNLLPHHHTTMPTCYCAPRRRLELQEVRQAVVPLRVRVATAHLVIFTQKMCGDSFETLGRLTIIFKY